MDTENKKTATIGALIEALRFFPEHLKIVQCEIIAEEPFCYPKRKPIDAVGRLKNWIKKFPKKTEVEQFFSKMENRLGLPLIIMWQNEEYYKSIIKD